MGYSVALTPQAIDQIHEIATYISRTLQEPEVAKHWVDFLYKEISELNFMPSRYALTDEEPWHANGIRKMPVKNFIVFYFVDEESKTVFVSAVIYGRRDQLSALTDMK